MASIVKLEHPSNVTLIGGASQYWEDRPRPQLDVEWSQLFVPQVSGRTLLIGWAPDATLRALASAAKEFHILQRGVVGASKAAEVVPEATVWCGEPGSLAEHTERFDTLICLADAYRIQSWEQEEHSWREVIDSVLALAVEHATVLLWVENDLGIHRLINTHNPRAERSDKDWDVLATMDASRPLTLEQVKAAFPGADVHLTWPSAQWNLIADPESVDPATHAAFAVRSAVAPLLGPDPVYILSTAARADRLGDYASGWLVTLRRRAPFAAPLLIAEQGRVMGFDQQLPTDSRSAFVTFAELAAQQDLAAVRGFIADWAATYATVGGSASFALNTVERTASGWKFTPLAGGVDKDPTDLRWEALGELVALIRGRAWRHLWPSNWTDARILNHLGIMAGLHTVSPARADQLIPPTPDVLDPYSQFSVHDLVAIIDRRNEELTAVRSELALTKLELEKALNQVAGPLRLPRKVLRFSKRAVKSLFSS